MHIHTQSHTNRYTNKHRHLNTDSYICIQSRYILHICTQTHTFHTNTHVQNVRVVKFKERDLQQRHWSKSVFYLTSDISQTFLGFLIVFSILVRLDLWPVTCDLWGTCCCLFSHHQDRPDQTRSTVGLHLYEEKVKRDDDEGFTIIQHRNDFFPLSSFTWRRASVDGHGTSAPRKRSPRSRLPFQPWRLQPPSVIHVLQSSQLVLLRNGFMSAVLCLWKPDVCLWDGSEQQNNNTGWAESKHSHSCGCKCIHFEQCGGRLD